MNLFSVHLSEDASEEDYAFVQALLVEIASVPGVDLVVYEGSLVVGEPAELPAAPELENGE